jgi:hypothetical protein
MTTSTSFVQGSADRETLEQLSDAELLRRAARQVLKVLCIMSKIMLVKPTLAVTRPAETGDFWCARWRNVSGPPLRS